MRYSITTTVASLCVALGSSAALAGGVSTPIQEAPVAQPTPAAPAPMFNWTGPYAGVQAGTFNSDGGFGFDGFPSDLDASLEADGTEYGVFGGYNWQGASALVYGVEGEYNWVDAQGSDVLDYTSQPGGGAADIDIDVGATAALRGRLGYAFDRTMVYATAGVAWIDYSLSETVGAAVTSDDFTNFGGTVGLGVEHAFGDRWIARVDYRYSDFGDIDEAGAEWDLTTSELRLGVAMSF